jgi:hypothetical protein
MKFVTINGIAVNAMHIVSIYPTLELWNEYDSPTGMYAFEVSLINGNNIRVGYKKCLESVNEMRKALLMSF